MAAALTMFPTSKLRLLRSEISLHAQVQFIGCSEFDSDNKSTNPRWSSDSSICFAAESIPGNIECGSSRGCDRRFCPCGCASGWRGTRCDQPTGCDSKPCQHGGSCTADGGSHTCACVGEWGGADCSQSSTLPASLAGGHEPAAAGGSVAARRWARSARADPPDRGCHGSRWKGTDCSTCAEGFFIAPYCVEVLIVSGTPDSEYSGMYVNTGDMSHGRPVYELGGDGSGKRLSYDRDGNSGYWWIENSGYGTGSGVLKGWFRSNGHHSLISISVMASCNTTCSCDGDWGGLDCNLPNCSKCNATCFKEQRCDCNCTTGHTVCKHDFSGGNCENDPCTGQSCSGHGICLRNDDGRGHKCSCYARSEWGGPECEQPPCQNNNDCGQHGTCQNQVWGVWGHKCNCHDNYTGERCQFAPCNRADVISDHSTGDCNRTLQHGEKCTPKCDEHHREGPSPDGYYMSYPEYRECDNGTLKYNAHCLLCSDSFCAHQGSCVAETDTRTNCNCSVGWTGQHCTKEDRCIVENPCQNGGTCNRTTAFGQDYKCICPTGFKGRNCSKLVTIWDTLNDTLHVACSSNRSSSMSCQAGASMGPNLLCWVKHDGANLSNCTPTTALSTDCQDDANRTAAQKACAEGEGTCGGIVCDPDRGTWQTCIGSVPLPSPSKHCWIVNNRFTPEAQAELEAVHDLCGTFAEAWKPLVSLLVSILTTVIYVWSLLRWIAVDGGNDTRLSGRQTFALVIWALVAMFGLTVEPFGHDWHEWHWVAAFAALALLANIPIAILWRSHKHRCSRIRSTVGSRLWRGVLLPLLAMALAGISASAVYKLQAQAQRLSQIAVGMEEQWLAVESVWAILSFGVLLPALPIAIAFAQIYRTQDQVGDLADLGWRLSHCRCCMGRSSPTTHSVSQSAASDNLSASDDHDHDRADGSSDRSDHSDAQRRDGNTQQLKIRKVLNNQDIHRVEMFLWAQSGFVRLSALLPFAVWVSYMANEMQVCLSMARQQAENPSDFRPRFSVDGVRALSPLVVTLNMATVVGLFLAAMWYPAPQRWSPFLFFGIIWSCVVGMMMTVVTIALTWSLSEPKKQAVRRDNDAIAAFRQQMLRDSFSVLVRNKSLAKRFFGYITSWHGQTLLSMGNHLFAIVLFMYGIIEFSAQLTRTLRIWLVSGIVLSCLGLVISGVSVVQRKWPVIKCTPTDDSFRLACVLKIALVMVKSTIVFLLAQVDDKTESFAVWETVVSIVSAISLLILALVTISLAVHKVWKQNYLLLEAGVWQPRLFIVLYIVSFMCSKVSTIFFMMQGHIPAYVGCKPTQVLFRVGTEQMKTQYMKDMTTAKASNCTMCYVESDSTNNLPDFCKGGELHYMCQTSCTRLFFTGGGNADQSLVTFVLAPMLWLPFVVYNNNECAQLIDGLWLRFSNRQNSDSSGTGSIGMRIGLATTGQGYYTTVPLIHAVTTACGMIILVFIGTGNSRGYSIDTSKLSDMLHADWNGAKVGADNIAHGIELLRALPQTCLIVTMGTLVLNSIMLLRVLVEFAFACGQSAQEDISGSVASASLSVHDDSLTRLSGTMLQTLLPGRRQAFAGPHDEGGNAMELTKPRGGDF